MDENDESQKVVDGLRVYRTTYIAEQLEVIAAMVRKGLVDGLKFEWDGGNATAAALNFAGLGTGRIVSAEPALQNVSPTSAAAHGACPKCGCAHEECECERDNDAD